VGWPGVNVVILWLLYAQSDRRKCTHFCIMYAICIKRVILNQN
jgi:hypothetical protein